VAEPLTLGLFELVNPDILWFAMAAPLPSKPARTLLDNQLSFKQLDSLVEVIREAIKWGSLVAIFYIIFLCVQSLAGKTTMANIGIRVLGNIKVSNGIIAVFGAGGWAYGLGQRSLRRKFIERNAGDKNRLEMLIDPSRSSSNLSKTGTTPKKFKG
jgi:hypothetical protein